MHKLITPYAADFGKPNVMIKQFPDTESYAYIPHISSLKKEKVTIYHRLYPEPDKRIFELLLVLSRVKEETKNIEIFIPYLPYARQDKAHMEGEVISANVLCGILKSFSVQKLITYDCHFLPKPGNFFRSGLKIENRSAGKQLVAFARKYFGKDKFTTIAPDQGSSYFIENAQGYALHKKRSRIDKNDIKTEVCVTEDCMVDVKGKNICILDDIIATGGTIIKAMEHLKAKGANKIIVGTTHGVFCGENIAEKILKENCDKLFMTNAILSKDESLKGLVEIIKLPKN